MSGSRAACGPGTALVTFISALEALVPVDDYKYSAVSPQRCVWDGSCETCPSAFLCNFR